MPPDHQPQDHEDLNRKLEELQRYVADLQRQRERARAAGARPAPAPDLRPPSRRWLLITGLLVTLALAGGVLVGAVAWSGDRPARDTGGATGAPSATRAPASTDVAGSATPACKTAVDRANTMLALTVTLQRELARYRTLMGDPSAPSRSGRQLVGQTAPSLQAGATASARLDQALAAYRQVVDQCKLNSP